MSQLLEIPWLFGCYDIFRRGAVWPQEKSGLSDGYRDSKYVGHSFFNHLVLPPGTHFGPQVSNDGRLIYVYCILNL